ncbi:MAG: type II toxin-antitoxin system VapC family toxin [Blastocatellia bacterium]
MRYLLDTHTFLWLWGESRRLPATVKTAIEDPSIAVYLSSVSLWEIAIKVRAGRLELGKVAPARLVGDAERMNIELINLEPDEAASHAELKEDTHFDPFDRMLIWQAISRKMVLVSGDEQFQRFKPDGLKLLWN